jgi:hypothetical protein
MILLKDISARLSIPRHFADVTQATRTHAINIGILLGVAPFKGYFEACVTHIVAVFAPKGTPSPRSPRHNVGKINGL